MCAIADCAPWDVVNDTDRRAAKPHGCTECGRTIQRGETYRHIHGLCDGLWATHKICAHCTAAAAWMHVVCGGYPLNALHEELFEHWRDGFRSAGLFKLIVGVRHGWRDGRAPVPSGVAAMARDMLAGWPEMAVAS